MSYNALMADDTIKEKRVMLEGSPTSRKRLRILAAKSEMTMREYLEWLAIEAEKRELVAPSLLTETPGNQPSTEE